MPGVQYPRALALRLEAEISLLREQMAARGALPKVLPPGQPPPIVRRGTTPGEAAPGKLARDGEVPRTAVEARPRKGSLEMLDGEPPPAGDSARLAWLMRKRRDALALRVDVFHALVQGQRVSQADPLVYDAYRNLYAADLELAEATGQPASERERLHMEWRDRALSGEKGALARFLAGAGPTHFGSVGTPAFDLAMAKSDRLEAEIAIVRERLRTGAAPKQP